MNPGIFETVFPRPTLVETYRAVAAAGFGCVQAHLHSTGVNPWTDDVPEAAVLPMADAARAAGVRIPALDATFNMAHPDPSHRAAGLAGFARIARATEKIGARYLTICTGTRDTTSMWKGHPDNGTPGAWHDLRETLDQALEIAVNHDLTVLVEPEPANVVNSWLAARRLLDEMGSDALRIVFDPANVVLSDRFRDPGDVLAEGIDVLGPDIAMAHAKDLDANGAFCAAGTGVVPWPRYWDLLRGAGFDGDVIFHTLTERDVPLALEVAAGMR